MKKVEYKHLLVRAETKSFFHYHEDKHLDNWVCNLIYGQNMEIMDGPRLKYLDEPGLAGWSATAMIKTSSFTLHVWDEDYPIRIYLDLFTCGKLDVDKVLLAVRAFGIARDFDGKSRLHYTVIDRDTGFEERDDVKGWIE